jgi:hypothetical protein
MAIILVVVGYFVGVFAAGNILLPLLWAWPKALLLQRERRLLQPIPITRFIVPPIIWTVVLGIGYL